MTFPSGGYTSAANAITDGCLHYYAMNETSGTTLEDSVAGGQGQTDGTVTSDISDASIVSGKFGNARDVTGPGINPHAIIAFARNAGTDDTTNYTNWSFSCWFHVDSSTNFGSFPRIFRFYNPSEVGYHPDLWIAGTGEVILTLGSGAGWSTTTQLSAGNTYHLVVTHDGTNYNLYLNNVNEISQTGTNQAVYYYHTEPGRLGVESETDDTSNQYLDGWIDDFAFWNRALSSGEVSTIYNTGAGTTILYVDPTLYETITSNFTMSLTASDDVIAYLLDAIQTGDTVSTDTIARVIEGLSLSGTLTSSSNQKYTIVDSTSLIESAYIAYSLLISENTNIADSPQDVIDVFKAIAEGFTIADVPSSQMTASNAIVVLASVLDTLKEITPISESVTASLSDVASILSNISITSNIGTTSSLSEYFSLFTIVEDTPSIDDSNTTSSSLYEELADSAEFLVKFQLDSAEYSGIVMNPENYALSTYTNHPFNSSTLYNDKVLFAGATGLYELGGTTDNSEYITARIKTAAMSFGTSNIKQVPEVLLGVSNSGKLVLVASVDGEYSATYELSLATNGLNTQQIKLGKGLKGRYWQFELVTQENTELDLDSLEFLPVTFGRKIR